MHVGLTSITLLPERAEWGVLGETSHPHVFGREWSLASPRLSNPLLKPASSTGWKLTRLLWTCLVRAGQETEPPGQTCPSPPLRRELPLFKPEALGVPEPRPLRAGY